MPNVTYPIPETEESVVRPLIFDITRQLFKFTKIDPETPILFPGNNDTTYQTGSTITKPVELNQFNSGARMQIEIDEDFNPEAVLSSAVLKAENRFFFNDTDLNIIIKPVYSQTTVSINFRYRTPDKVAGMRWRDEIRTRISMNRDMGLFEAGYHYIIPPAYIAILQHLWKLRERQGAYGETYEQYLGPRLSERASVIANLAGGHQTWAISERQIGIVGYFDFEAAPDKGDRDGDGEAWVISFSFKFMYDKPVECVMQYPLVVHNSVLSERWRPAEPVYKAQDYARAYAWSRKMFRPFESDYKLSGICRHSGVGIPKWDEFIPSIVIPKTDRIFTAMVVLDPADLEDLLHFDQLGEKQITPLLLNYIKVEAPFMLLQNQSIFNLTLYRGFDPLDNSNLVVGQDLSVRATAPLDIRQPYHVRFGLLNDLRLLSRSGLLRFCQNGLAALEILKSIDCRLARLGLLPGLIDGWYLNPGDVLGLFPFLYGPNSGYGTGIGGDGSSDQIRQWNTSQTFFINTHKAG